jgi:hypothetical protein
MVEAGQIWEEREGRSNLNGDILFIVLRICRGRHGKSSGPVEPSGSLERKLFPKIDDDYMCWWSAQGLHAVSEKVRNLAASIKEEIGLLLTERCTAFIEAHIHG